VDTFIYYCLFLKVCTRFFFETLASCATLPHLKVGNISRHTIKMDHCILCKIALPCQHVADTLLKKNTNIMNYVELMQKL